MHDLESTILVGIFLAGTAASLVGMFMWQGPWATLAAMGLYAALFATAEAQR